MKRTLGISEARRLLPELVRSVATDGGRVDITYRGKTQVSLLRASDVKRATSPLAHSELDPALRVVLKIPDRDLIDVIRALRAKQGHPRTALLAEEVATPHRKGATPKLPRRTRK